MNKTCVESEFVRAHCLEFSAHTDMCVWVGMRPIIMIVNDPVLNHLLNWVFFLHYDKLSIILMHKFSSLHDITKGYMEITDNRLQFSIFVYMWSKVHVNMLLALWQSTKQILPTTGQQSFYYYKSSYAVKMSPPSGE